jgi:hypothetical protein
MFTAIEFAFVIHNWAFTVRKATRAPLSCLMIVN